MARTPEGKVKDNVRKLLDFFGPDLCWYYMPVQTGFGRAGIPDFIVCLLGFFFAIETKKGKSEKPRTRQIFTIEDIRRAGGTAIYVHEHNFAAFEKTLRDFVNGRRICKQESPGAATEAPRRSHPSVSKTPSR